MFQKNGGYAPVTQVLGNVGNQKSLGLLTPLESTRHVLYLILVQTQSLQQKQDHSPLHQEKKELLTINRSHFFGVLFHVTPILYIY